MSVGSLLGRAGLWFGRHKAEERRGGFKRASTLVPSGTSGCKIELTFLEVDNTKWTTLGFEAFGPESHQRETLEAVAFEFFQSRPLCPLDLSAI